MRHVPIAEFKDRASEIIAAAEAGEEIIITRHGKAAARLTGVDRQADRAAQRREILDKLAGHRAAMRARGLSVTREEIIAWKGEGRH